MITVGNERWTFTLYKRLPNSSYLYEETPSATFKGRPANQMEVRQFRIQQGVNGNNGSTFVVCSNFPESAKPGDKVIFMGKECMVMSIGYYFDQARVINPSLMSDEYMAKRCPKGMNIQ